MALRLGVNRSKKSLDQDVLTLALERIEYCYRRFDKVVVSFSGGKDSTALLHLTLSVARRLERLPLHAVFFDEEAIHPPTIEYVERVRQHPDIRLDWYCLPVKHRNACSNESPWWYCWDPNQRDKWVREMPAWALTTHPRFTFGEAFQDFSRHLFDKSEGNVCMLQGLRGQESLRRTRIMLRKKNDNWLNSGGSGGNYFGAYPIYDWSSEDVWRLVAQWGLDYNRTYDVFNKTELYGRLLHQRVCPPYGEEPIRGLWVYAECFPEMWHKMLYRVPGCATAWRYANTELYSFGTKKPEGVTWQQFAEISASYYEGEEATAIRKLINEMIERHRKQTDIPIDDETSHPVSGISWRFICQLVIRGDFKGRKKESAKQLAIMQAAKLGLTPEEARNIYGKRH